MLYSFTFTHLNKGWVEFQTESENYRVQMRSVQNWSCNDKMNQTTKIQSWTLELLLHSSISFHCIAWSHWSSSGLILLLAQSEEPPVLSNKTAVNSMDASNRLATSIIQKENDLRITHRANDFMIWSDCQTNALVHIQLLPAQQAIQTLLFWSLFMLISQKRSSVSSKNIWDLNCLDGLEAETQFAL